MATITLDDIKRILVSCAGAEDGVDLGDGFADRAFEELGYDSLALMESVAVIKQEFGVALPDDDVATAETPQQLLDIANGVLAAH